MYEIIGYTPKQRVTDRSKKSLCLKIALQNKNRLIKEKLVFMLIKKYSSFSFQKTLTVIEFTRIGDLSHNLMYIKFINILTSKKSSRKKRFFVKKLYYTHLIFGFYKKFTLLMNQFYPIIIQNLMKSKPLLKKNNRDIYLVSKNSGVLRGRGENLNFNKKKISIKKFYNNNLPEYTQSLGWFDSTGRRINTFSMILDKVLYIFKKINSLISYKQLNPKVLLEEITSLLIDTRTGRYDIFTLCILKNYREYPKIKATISNWLKWLLLDEDCTWNQKLSNKIKLEFFFEHNSLSSDISSEKKIKKLVNIKLYSLSKKFKFKCKIKMLKNTYENFKIYFSTSRKYLLIFKNSTVFGTRGSLFKQSQILAISTIPLLSNCVIGTSIYKESFFKINFNLYESVLFVSMWIFFENTNCILITLDLYYNVFQKSISLFSHYFRNILKNTSKSNCFDNSSCKLKKKIKKCLVKNNSSRFFSFSTINVQSEINRILKKILPMEKQGFIWYIATQTSSYQKLSWIETLVIFDTLMLVKEYLTEKIKKIFKRYTKKEYNKENYFSFIQPYKICTIQTLIRNKKQPLLNFTIIDTTNNSEIKRITLTYDTKLIIPLLIFICVRFKISFLFFIFKSKLDEHLLVFIKKQFVKTTGSKSFQLFSSYFKLTSKVIFDLINCIVIPADDTYSILKNKPTYLTWGKNPRVFTIIQLILRGPLVYLWFLGELNLTRRKIVGLNSEIFFISNTPLILLFNLKQLYFNQYNKIFITQEKKDYKMIDRSFYNMGPQKLFYVLDKILLNANEHKKIENCIPRSIYSIETVSTCNQVNFYYKKNVDFLSNIRILGFKIYKTFKKILCHTSIIKWYYQLVHNIFKTRVSLSVLNLFKIGGLDGLFEIKKKNHIYLSKISKILIKYLENQFTPKIIYLTANKKKKLCLDEKLSGKFKSWREMCIELNTHRNVTFFDKFKKSRMNMIQGTFSSGFNFFIEKNFISNYDHRFNYLIFKKLSYIPAKIISIYPKISQIKFSSLIDDKRFLVFNNQSNYAPLAYNSYSNPFKFLQKQYNFSYCSPKSATNLVRNKKLNNWFVRVSTKNSFKISFITDEKLLYFFTFQIDIFWDKKYSRFIYKWKRKIFAGSERIYQNFLKPFRIQFDLIANHKDFISCGPILFKNFVNLAFQEGKQISNFFFTFADDEFLIFDFIFRNKIGFDTKGQFYYSSGVYFLNNNRHLDLDSIKNAIMKEIEIT